MTDSGNNTKPTLRAVLEEMGYGKRYVRPVAKASHERRSLLMASQGLNAAPFYGQDQDPKGAEKFAGRLGEAREGREEEQRSERMRFVTDPNFAGEKSAERLARGEEPSTVAMYPATLEEYVARHINIWRTVAQIPDAFIHAGQAIARDVVNYALNPQFPGAGDRRIANAQGHQGGTGGENQYELPPNADEIDDPFVRYMLGLDTPDGERAPGRSQRPTLIGSEALNALAEFATFPANAAKNVYAAMNPLVDQSIRNQAVMELSHTGGADVLMTMMMGKGLLQKAGFDPMKADVSEAAKRGYTPPEPPPEQVAFDQAMVDATKWTDVELKQNLQQKVIEKLEAEKANDPNPEANASYYEQELRTWNDRIDRYPRHKLEKLWGTFAYAEEASAGQPLPDGMVSFDPAAVYEGRATRASRANRETVTAESAAQRADAEQRAGKPVEEGAAEPSRPVDPEGLVYEEQNTALGRMNTSEKTLQDNLATVTRQDPVEVFGPSGYGTQGTMEHTGTNPVPFHEIDIRRRIQQTLRTVVRMARSPHFKGKDAWLGLFNTLTDVIRLKDITDTATLAHEVTHFIDKYLIGFTTGKRNPVTRDVGMAGEGWTSFRDRSTWLTKELAGEIKKHDYDKTQMRLSEGFEELVRKWASNHPLDDAPLWVDFWENKFLPANPTLKDLMYYLRDSITTINLQGAHFRFMGKIDYGLPGLRKFYKIHGAREGTSLLLNDFIYKWYDSIHGFKRYSRDIMKQMGHKARGFPETMAHVDPYQVATWAKGTEMGKAHAALYDGVRDLAALEQKSPGLIPILHGNAIDPATGKTTGFSPKLDLKVGGHRVDPVTALLAYGQARSLLERVEKQGFKVEEGTLKDAHFIVNNPLHESFPATAKQITNWTQSLLHLLVEAGRLTEAEFQLMTTMNDLYFPLRRILEGQGMDPATALGQGVQSFGPALARAHGSTAVFKDPLVLLATYPAAIFKLVHQTMVRRAIVDSANMAGGAGRWVEELPGFSKGLQIERELGSIRKELAEAGVKITPEQAKKLFSIYQPLPQNLRSHNRFIWYDQGKLKEYEVNWELVQALDGMDGYMSNNLIANMSNRAVRAVRLGATGLSPGFTIGNLLKDLMTYTLYSVAAPLDLKNPSKSSAWTLVRAAKEIVTRGEEWQQARAAGFDMSGQLGMDRQAHKELLDVVRTNPVLARDLNIVQHPVDALRVLFDGASQLHPVNRLRLTLGQAELLPRLAEYMNKKAQMKGSEINPLATHIASSNAASNVTLNFRRAGVHGQVLNGVYAFFNARLQGPARLAEEMSNPQTARRLALRGLGMLTLPALSLWALNKDKEWYRNSPPWLRYGFLSFETGAHYEDGRPVIMRVPIPHELGLMFAAWPVAMADYLYGTNPQAMDEIVKYTPGVLSPIDLPSDFRSLQDVSALLPTAVKPLAEVAGKGGYSEHRQQEIVPYYMAVNSFAEDVERPWTTETMKAFGRHFGVDPAKYEWLIAGYSGGLGLDALRASDQLGNLIGLLPPKGLEDKGPEDLPVLGRFFFRVPPEAERAADKEHERRNEVAKVKNHIESLRKQGRLDEIPKWQERLNEIQRPPSMMRRRLGPRRPGP